MNLKSALYLLRSITPIPLRRGMARAGLFASAGIPGDANFPGVFPSLQVLKSLGFSSRACIDVGAYHGEWTKLFRSVFPDAAVHMIEAQEGKRARLESVASTMGGDITLDIALLGPEEGRRVQFHEMETGSSVFAESSPYERRTEDRTMRTLDAVVAARRFPRADFLKLDVQGYELEVLKGGAAVLGQVEAVLLEASLVPVNKGAPAFAEVIAFLDGAGFQLFDFCSQVRRTDGVLWQTDLLFLRAGSRHLPEPRLTRENWG